MVGSDEIPFQNGPFSGDIRSLFCGKWPEMKYGFWI